MNDLLMRFVLLTHLSATLFMTGVIWFVQVIHYPLLASIGHGDFVAYERRNTALTTFVVGPAMLVEGLTAVLLLWFRPAGVSLSGLWVGLALLGVVWLSTAFIQVPCHELLSNGVDLVVVQRLVWTNWLRTVAWTLRSVLVCWVIWSLMGSR